MQGKMFATLLLNCPNDNHITAATSSMRWHFLSASLFVFHFHSIRSNGHLYALVTRLKGNELRAEKIGKILYQKVIFDQHPDTWL